jgi:hypothetical protein
VMHTLRGVPLPRVRQYVCLPVSLAFHPFVLHTLVCMPGGCPHIASAHAKAMPKAPPPPPGKLDSKRHRRTCSLDVMRCAPTDTGPGPRGGGPACFGGGRSGSAQRGAGCACGPAARRHAFRVAALVGGHSGEPGPLADGRRPTEGRRPPHFVCQGPEVAGLAVCD